MLSNRGRGVYAASAARRSWLMSDASGRFVTPGRGSTSVKRPSIGGDHSEGRDLSALTTELSRGYSSVEVLRQPTYPSPTGSLPGLLNYFPHLPDNLVSARAAVAIAVLRGATELSSRWDDRVAIRKSALKNTNSSGSKIMLMSPSSKASLSEAKPLIAPDSATIADGDKLDSEKKKIKDITGEKWLRFVMANVTCSGEDDALFLEIVQKLLKLSISPSFSKLPSRASLPRELFLLLDASDSNISSVLRRRMPTNIVQKKPTTTPDAKPRLRSVPTSALHKTNSPGTPKAQSIGDGPPMVPGITEMFFVPDERIVSAGYSSAQLSTHSFKRRPHAQDSHWEKLVKSVNAKEQEVEEAAGVAEITPEKKSGTPKTPVNKLTNSATVTPKNLMIRKRLSDIRRPSRGGVKRPISSSTRSSGPTSTPSKTVSKPSASSSTGLATSTRTDSPASTPKALSLPRRATRSRRPLKDWDSDDMDSVEKSSDDENIRPRTSLPRLHLPAITKRRHTVPSRLGAGSRSVTPKKARISGRVLKKDTENVQLPKITDDMRFDGTHCSPWTLFKYWESLPSFGTENKFTVGAQEYDSDDFKNLSIMLYIGMQSKSKKMPNVFDLAEETDETVIESIRAKGYVGFVDLPEEELMRNWYPANPTLAEFHGALTGDGESVRTQISMMNETNILTAAAPYSKQIGNQDPIVSPLRFAESPSGASSEGSTSEKRAESLFKRVCGDSMITMQASEREKVRCWAAKDFTQFDGESQLDVTVSQKPVVCARCDGKHNTGDSCEESIVLMLRTDLTWKKVRRLRHVIGSES